MDWITHRYSYEQTSFENKLSFEFLLWIWQIVSKLMLNRIQTHTFFFHRQNDEGWNSDEIMCKKWCIHIFGLRKTMSYLNRVINKLWSSSVVLSFMFWNILNVENKTETSLSTLSALNIGHSEYLINQDNKHFNQYLINYS